MQVPQILKLTQLHGELRAVFFPPKLNPEFFSELIGSDTDVIVLFKLVYDPFLISIHRF